MLGPPQAPSSPPVSVTLAAVRFVFKHACAVNIPYRPANHRETLAMTGPAHGCVMCCTSVYIFCAAQPPVFGLHLVCLIAQ
jgi:hypothetical protein